MQSQFRTWMTSLCKPAGDRPEWPLLIQWMLQEQLKREQEIERSYTGKKILISRRSHNYEKATIPEKRAVYGLYHKCLCETEGCLTIEQDHYWLLSYEVPNQGRHRMQRADMLGLSLSGGLVVFECKLKHNSYTPLASLLEGLDYLAALTSKLNFDRLTTEFPSLKQSLGLIPTGFEDVKPNRDACHEVIVMAPAAYYKKYDETKRGSSKGGLGKGWEDSSTVRFRFAVSECDSQGFFCPNVTWSHLV